MEIHFTFFQLKASNVYATPLSCGGEHNKGEIHIYVRGMYTHYAIYPLRNQRENSGRQYVPNKS